MSTRRWIYLFGIIVGGVGSTLLDLRTTIGVTAIVISAFACLRPAQLDPATGGPTDA